GNQVTYSNNSSIKSEKINIPSLKEGTYYIQVYGNKYYDEKPYTLTYNIKVTRDGYENNGSLEKATVLNDKSGTIKGNIHHPNDYDYYKIQLSEDSKVEIDLTNLPQNYYLALLNDKGNQVTYSNNSSIKSEKINIPSLKEGTYYIQVYGNRYYDEKPYTLTYCIGDGIDSIDKYTIKNIIKVNYKYKGDEQSVYFLNSGIENGKIKFYEDTIVKVQTSLTQAIPYVISNGTLVQALTLGTNIPTASDITKNTGLRRSKRSIDNFDIFSLEVDLDKVEIMIKDFVYNEAFGINRNDFTENEIRMINTGIVAAIGSDYTFGITDLTSKLEGEVFEFFSGENIVENNRNDYYYCYGETKAHIAVMILADAENEVIKKNYDWVKDRINNLRNIKISIPKIDYNSARVAVAGGGGVWATSVSTTEVAIGEAGATFATGFYLASQLGGYKASKNLPDSQHRMNRASKKSSSGIKEVANNRSELGELAKDRNGHMQKTHVQVNDVDIKNRSKNKPNRPATRWKSKDTLFDTLEDVLKNNSDDIADWIDGKNGDFNNRNVKFITGKNGERRLRIQFRENDSLGFGYRNEQIIPKEEIKNAIFILQESPNKYGFEFITGYPCK
ncbi:pre-peptidase C-terminal domain-containing protein, partial [Tepidibacter sp. Z1-5]|uniref:pre-peptidase C-terminal domain-containing protein n=1 Tax=Tepidibacter sp. Z1-5 TaxID=3134138 RepID=UPI0030C02912